MLGKLSLRPWLTMWVRPRDTIRDIVRTNPKSQFFLLSAVYGFPMLLQLAQNLSLGATMSTALILIVSLILATPLGALLINAIAGLLYWTGGWIGGKAPFGHVRAAVAWSNVPNIVNLAIWLILTAHFGSALYQRTFAEMTFVGPELALVFFGFLIQVVVSVWGFIMILKTLGEVQGFSAWKALLNILIPLFMVWIAFMVVMWLGYAFIPAKQ
ncbi:MAG: YIP1 family protein [Verrucomicrobia bacterium]|nr:YIP1 family protein [Verrucomicrobiota bacterium]